MVQDAAFEAALRAAVDAEVERELARDATRGEHRRLMDRARLLVGAFLWDRCAYAGQSRLIESALESVRALRLLQGPSGLFIGGDNVDSPPDSSFTINDLCDTLRLLEVVAHPSDPVELGQLRDELDAMADAAEPALTTGGVHTPNHRWEISAALARLHRRRPAVALAERAAQWLAEGIDITVDGVYSERSANYAAYVSNPSLTMIADVFERADARAAVVRNLESTLGMIHPDGSVETIHSRRQDQLSRFALAPYLGMYRRYAIQHGRGDFAWAAERALDQGVVHPGAVLTDLLLDPRLGEQPPAAVPPSPGGSWPQISLVVDDTCARRLVVYGGSDYAGVRRVRSGLAANPTFLRMFVGDAVLDSVRLSRDFFGLGPFRAEGIMAADGRLRLSETVSAFYYQPMTEAGRDAEGRYALTDDGRFYGSMSFPDRVRDEVSLRTSIDVAPVEDGAGLEFVFDGPDCAWTLELAFRGGHFEGVEASDDGAAVLAAGAVRYRAGDTAIEVAAHERYQASGPARYRPGEDYAFLGATDAAGGDRLYLTGRAPGRLALTLRAVSV